MTPKQKAQRIEKLKSLIASKDYTVDSYGNYKLDDYRFKFKKIVLCLQHKGHMQDWYNCCSWTISQMDMGKFTVYLTRRTSAINNQTCEV